MGKNIPEKLLRSRITKEINEKYGVSIAPAVIRTTAKTVYAVAKNLLTSSNAIGQGAKEITTIADAAVQSGGRKIIESAKLGGTQGALLQGEAAWKANIHSNSTWAIAAVVCVVEVSRVFADYNKGKISGKQFFVRSGIKITANHALGSFGGAAGASFGATIGTLIFPGIGTVIGAIIGSVAGGISASIYSESILAGLLTTEVEKRVDSEIQTPEEIYKRMLILLNLRDGCTFAELDSQKRKLAFVYHPDKSGSNEMFVMIMHGYEIVKTYKKERKDVDP